MKQRLSIIFALVLVAMTSGCVNTQLTGDVDPSVEMSSFETFYVAHNPDDKRDLEKVIAGELAAIGKNATSGVEPAPPEPVDVIVTYQDKWMWDITMYLLELNLEFRDPETNYQFATGRSYRTSLGRKSPEFMTREILGEVFGIEIPEED
jgi:hypothetical protein